MAQKVLVNCGQGKDAYQIYMTAADVEVFVSLVDHKSAKNKEGEELVAALVAAAEGKITKVERKKDGVLNDTPSGKPAVQRFLSTIEIINIAPPNPVKHFIYAFNKTASILRTRLVEELHYQNGLLNDGANGEEAVRKFDRFGAAGRVLEVARYKDGELIAAPGVTLSQQMPVYHEAQQLKDPGATRRARKAPEEEFQRPRLQS